MWNYTSSGFEMWQLLAALRNKQIMTKRIDVVKQLSKVRLHLPGQTMKPGANQGLLTNDAFL